jgi:hypothetical protein
MIRKKTWGSINFPPRIDSEVVYLFLVYGSSFRRAIVKAVINDTRKLIILYSLVLALEPNVIASILV